MQVLTRLMSLALLLLVLPQAKVVAEEASVPYSQAELDQMLAPVALYPDSVLAQMLIAATYPLDIIEAAHWSRAHPDLKGDVAVAAVEDKDWDPSVKAMVAFPDIIDRMERDLDWVAHLGDAFLRQEEQVMATIQDLRERAYVAGNLEAPANIRVYREPEVIIIEPVNPRVVYVPYYNPWTIYGSWWWPAHPPYHWGPRHHYYTHNVFYWGSGINFSVGFFYSNFDWHHRHTVVHVHHHQAPSYYKHGVPHYKHVDFRKHYRKWQHKPARRHHEVRRTAQSHHGIEARQRLNHDKRVGKQHSPHSRKYDNWRSGGGKPSYSKVERHSQNSSRNGRPQIPNQMGRFQGGRQDERTKGKALKDRRGDERYSRVVRSLGDRTPAQKRSPQKSAVVGKSSQNSVQRLNNNHSGRSGFGARAAADKRGTATVSPAGRQLRPDNLSRREPRPQTSYTRERQSSRAAPTIRTRGIEQRQQGMGLAKPGFTRHQRPVRSTPPQRQQGAGHSFAGKSSHGFSRSDSASVAPGSRNKLGR